MDIHDLNGVVDSDCVEINLGLEDSECLVVESTIIECFIVEVTEGGNYLIEHRDLGWVLA